MTNNPGKVVSISQFSELFASAWSKAMTPQNILSSFRATGVHPVNRGAIEIPGEKRNLKSTPMADIAKSHGISYLPLYSPAPRRHPAAPLPSSLEFTEEEERRFQKRYDEGYDIPGDSRYEAWLQRSYPHDDSLTMELFPHVVPTYSGDQLDESLQLGGDHLDGSLQSPSTNPRPPCVSREHSPPEPSAAVREPALKTKLGQFLTVPTPPAARNVKTKGARVLTSSDDMRDMEEKERMKREKAELKEEKKRLREEKAKERAAQKALKAAQRLAKAAGKKSNVPSSGTVAKTGTGGTSGHGRSLSGVGTRGRTGVRTRSHATCGKPTGSVPCKN